MPVSRTLDLSSSTYLSLGDANLPPGFTQHNLQHLFCYLTGCDRMTSHRINFAPNGIHIRRWGESYLTYHPTKKVLTISDRWSHRMKYVVLFYDSFSSRNRLTIHSGRKAVIMVVETGNLYFVRGR